MPDLAAMTFWSRYDPIRQPKGNTDHWSKFRQRTTYQVSFGNKVYDVHTTDQALVSSVAKPKFFTDKNFDGLLVDGLRGSMPNSGDYNMRPRHCIPRSMMRSAYNERARDGFRYWLIERPKPTNFGKYGIGSYKTVLGIGNAPRT